MDQDTVSFCAHVCEPYHPETYRDDAAIPFAPDGNAPLISAYVERVKGISSPFRGLKCVRKTVDIDTRADAESQALLKRRLVQEAKILYVARHYHVVQLIHTYFDHTDEGKVRYAVIMDRADTNLQTYLEPGRTPALQWFACLIRAVHHIHTLGIRHRDIKPSNVLVQGGRILLADFGISQMGLGKTMPTTYQDRKPARTREYCAPEVDRGSTRGRSADIFSLGAVFLEMLVALNDPKYSAELTLVLKGPSESTTSYSNHVNDVHKWIEDSFHPLGWQGDFLVTCRRMLHQDRDTRPSAEDIQKVWTTLPLPDTAMVCTCTGSLAPTKSERLIEACKEDSESDVRSLLEQGAESGNSEAIHYAAARGSSSIVQALIDAGVHVDTPNSVGQTPLQCAARNGHADVVRQLLRNSANVNIRDENDHTALHGAAAQGHETIVMMLLDAQADAFAEDLDGQMALHFAARRHHNSVQALLESHSEQINQR